MASDNFPTNGTPPPGWTQDATVSDPMFSSSGIVRGTNFGVLGMIYYGSSSVESSQIEYVAGFFFANTGPALRYGDGDGYYTNGTALKRLDGGEDEDLDASGPEVGVGDVVRLFRDGSDLVVLVNGVEEIRHADTTYTGACNPALVSLAGDFGHMDNWTDAGGGAPGPSITNVDGDNAVTSDQEDFDINGTDFDTATVDFEQGSVVVPQSIGSQDATSITLDDVTRTNGSSQSLKFGTVTARVTNDDDQDDTITFQLDPPSGQQYVDIVTPASDPEWRIETDGDDLESGDQVWGAGDENFTTPMPDGHTIEDDGSITVAEGYTPTPFWAMVWDHDDATLGDPAPQSIDGDETGSGAILLDVLTVAGAGNVTRKGTGDIVLDSLVISGSGTVTRKGTGAIVLEALTLSGSGSVSSGAIGSGSIVLDELQLAGVGEITNTGSGAIVFDPFQVSGSGVVNTTITGSGAISLSAILVNGTGGGLVVEGQLQTIYLEDAEPVPTPAYFRAGIAYSADNKRYVCSWPANNAVSKLRGEAIRNDGAQCILASVDVDDVYYTGFRYTARGEVRVSTSAADFYLAGYGMVNGGMMSMSEIS